jgi:hypothetical protein
MNTTSNPTPEKKRTRATDAEIAVRVEDVLYARLNGAELYDLVGLAKEKGWKVSKRTLQRYAEAADRKIEESLEKDRVKLLRRHLAQRRSLFARAVNDGDVRAALAIAQDEAELEGLYPRKGLELTGAGGTPLIGKMTDAERDAAITGILKRFGIEAQAAAAAPSPGSDHPHSAGQIPADGSLLERPGPDSDGRGV